MPPTKSATSPSTATPKKKKPAAAKKEKRLKRFRATCSNAVQQRIVRARTQRLFLVEPPQQFSSEAAAVAPPPPPAPAANGSDEKASNNNGNTNNNHHFDFVVMGSTGNLYTVTISQLVQCTCPDCARGNICKHILFVMLKVIGLPPNSPLIYQAALITEELQEIANLLTQRMAQVGRAASNSHSFMADERVQKAYNELKSPNSKQADKKEEEEEEDEASGVKRQSAEGEDCPICFDPLANEKLVYCKAVCGANFHATCINTWKQQQQHRGTFTCPNCRSEWMDDEQAAKKTSGTSPPEGYTNLGRLQGQSSRRDTSTYSEWYGYHSGGHSNKRRRR